MTQKMMNGYETALPWITYGGIGQSVIDAISFHLSNYLVYKMANKSVAYTDLWQSGVFFAVDLLERNVIIPHFVSKGLPMSVGVQNGMIAGLSFLVSTILDFITGKNTKNAITHNLVSNAVGFGSNVVIDYVIPDALV